MELPHSDLFHALGNRSIGMTLKKAYEEAGRLKKGLIVDGQIGGRQREQRLVEYVNKNASREVGITDETSGFLIVRFKRGGNGSNGRT